MSSDDEDDKPKTATKANKPKKKPKPKPETETETEPKPETEAKPDAEDAPATAYRGAAAGADPFDAVKASWGFPSFAKTFPRHPELDALVEAFARGDYMSVRQRAPVLAKDDAVEEDVRTAARTLRARIEPDPTSRILLLVAAGLLVFLTVWWVLHDGAEGGSQSKPKPVTPAPKVEHVD